MNNELVGALTQAGKTTATWTSPDGSELLVLPYGGRILGLFSAGSIRNFFWTHPALDRHYSAAALYESGQWHNSGGDRTWLAPEVDFFFPKFPDVEVYWEPRELDPGAFSVIRNDACGIALASRMKLRLSRSQQTVQCELSKTITPAANPLRKLAPPLASNLAYAGYTLKTELDISPCNGYGNDVPRVGVWNLIQLPHGGDLIMPTVSRAPITKYMGRIRDADLLQSDHLICYRMRAGGKHKIGIEATSAVGRVGYLYSLGEESCLVIRNFVVNPSGEYVDVPWDDPGGPGCAIQACLISCDELGHYAELEYHAPAIGGASKADRCEDESQVWAFRGMHVDVIAAARTLLSSDLSNN